MRPLTVTNIQAQQPLINPDPGPQDGGEVRG